MSNDSFTRMSLMLGRLLSVAIDVGGSGGAGDDDDTNSGGFYNVMRRIIFCMCVGGILCMCASVSM